MVLMALPVTHPGWACSGRDHPVTSLVSEQFMSLPSLFTCWALLRRLDSALCGLICGGQKDGWPFLQTWPCGCYSAQVLSLLLPQLLPSPVHQRAAACPTSENPNCSPPTLPVAPSHCHCGLTMCRMMLTLTAWIQGEGEPPALPLP